MRAPAYLFALMSALLPWAAPTDVDRLELSLQTWANQRQAWGDSYRYRVSWHSVFGFGNTTTVDVQQGKVVRRAYEAWGRDPIQGRQEPGERWEETGSQLGSHQSGAQALTLEQLYDVCRRLLRKPLPDEERQTLVLDERGVLQACYRFNRRIADDAPKVGVPYIELTPL